MANATTTALAAIGAVAILYLVIGIWLDVRSFDQTKGGYSAPYVGWTGEPIDWESSDRTKEGVVKRGRVIDVFVDLTTGMITFQAAGMRYHWQTFSDRALVVHKPREAAVALGFQPEF